MEHQKIDYQELLKELKTKAIFLKDTTYGKNKIYTFTKAECPNLMLEVGRLREEAFSMAGGGSGKKYDIDKYDDIFSQLIVWNDEKQKILGGYRYYLLNNIKNYENQTPTLKLFVFSNKFKTKYAPNTLELGRSFVRRSYQVTQTKQSLFILDNLWEGLGALVYHNNAIKYFFGKITMYKTYPQQGRELITFFMEKYFKSNLVYPKKQYAIKIQEREKISQILNAKDLKTDWKILQNELKKLSLRIPPLFSAYMNLSPTMKYFGTALNKHFGNVEESGIMITIEDIYNKKLERYLYSNYNQ